ncbi:DMT family transporter [Granulosicoccus antarcticus]|uniref:Riboflavin transporter n=1 Tax=Granulosicoccus antarcticus IMCC3135 TaxID=1192854 RepID=A0A2Z2P1H2_9GAMM|nr:DMT family transporter [Granulosicoccus antarcticus]ASJ76048.1 Riboflavin transporter [Granulosicoccus antarcticus IMCC3135]
MDNSRGSLFMVLAMAAFALEDMFIKAATLTLPVGQVLLIFGLSGTIVFAILARRQGSPVFDPSSFSRVMVARSGFEIMGRLCFTLAIALTPLSNASAILQATPLVVAVGAVFVFGETVGWRRWSAICIGFIGVLLILRPGLSGFEPASIFAVLGTIGFAGRDLATKAAPPQLTNAQLGVYGFTMLMIAGIIALSYTGGAMWPDISVLSKIAAATVFGVLAYSALTNAMRLGEVSAVAPFRYSRLVFAMLIGVVVFGERPDTLTLIGSAIVVGSGLYTVLRQRRVDTTDARLP